MRTPQPHSMFCCCIGYNNKHDTTAIKPGTDGVAVTRAHSRKMAQARKAQQYPSGQHHLEALHLWLGVRGLWRRGARRATALDVAAATADTRQHQHQKRSATSQQRSLQVTAVAPSTPRAKLSTYVAVY